MKLLKRWIEIIYKNTLRQIFLSFTLASIFFSIDFAFYGEGDDNVLTYIWGTLYGIFLLIVLRVIAYGLIINPIKALIKKRKNK